MDWTAIIITFLGSSALSTTCSHLINRRANARLKEEEAEQAEVETEEQKFTLLERRCAFLEQRLIDADKRDVDKTAQIRRLNELILTEREEKFNLRIELALKRCDRKKCKNRQPPNGT